MNSISIILSLFLFLVFTEIFIDVYVDNKYIRLMLEAATFAIVVLGCIYSFGIVFYE